MADLTQERLKELLRYEPETGLFYWVTRPSNRVRVGDIAGCKEKSHGGYILIGIDGVVYGAHRLAWLHVNGAMPEAEIDHKNGDPSDNRICNLRHAMHSQNLKNIKRAAHNTSGLKGVHFHRQSGKWRARLCADGKYISLGLHKTKELAHSAYCAGAERHHGEFARFG